MAREPFALRLLREPAKWTEARTRAKTGDAELPAGSTEMVAFLHHVVEGCAAWQASNDSAHVPARGDLAALVPAQVVALQATQRSVD